MEIKMREMEKKYERKGDLTVETWKKGKGSKEGKRKSQRRNVLKERWGYGPFESPGGWKGIKGNQSVAR